MAIANAFQLEAARRRAVPTRFNMSPVASFKSLTLSVAVLESFTAYTLRYAVTLNFDPVTLTFDIWSWTFVVDRLHHARTLYEIWAQSGNPRRSYCSFNFDPMTLNMYRGVGSKLKVGGLIPGQSAGKFFLGPPLFFWAPPLFFLALYFNFRWEIKYVIYWSALVLSFWVGLFAKYI